MRLPTIYRGGWAGFLPSKSIGALAKVGGKKSHYFLPRRLLSPLFRDLDLIPSGYGLIPSKGGSWCALTRGVGPCPHYPRPCGSPHAGGPHSGTFYNLPGTIPKNPEHFPVAKIGLPIYKSLPPDHSGTPCDIRDLIRDSEQHSVTTYKLPL